MDVWKTSFISGRPVFRCYISFREGIYWIYWGFLNSIASTNWMFPKIVVPPQIILFLIGFSIIFTIHFGGPPLLLETPNSILGFNIDTKLSHLDKFAGFIWPCQAESLSILEPKKWPPATRTTPISLPIQNALKQNREWYGSRLWVPGVFMCFGGSWRNPGFSPLCSIIDLACNGIHHSIGSTIPMLCLSMTSSASVFGCLVLSSTWAVLFKYSQ